MDQRATCLTECRELSDQDLSAILARLNARSDLPSIESYKTSCVKRRIAARIRHCGCQNPKQYLDRLSADPDEAHCLAASFSIHVSQFFRNTTLFDTLQKVLLPKLVHSAAGDRLRFWSIGCSGGQEPYSLAMLLLESFPGQAEQGQFEILATDIDAGMLTLAENGRYAAQALDGVSPQRKERFFAGSDHNYILCPEVRGLVRFKQMDLQQFDSYCHADGVLCRNTLIYFNRTAQQKILHAIADILPQGGILVLGKSESMPTLLRSRFAPLDPVERIYGLR